jgi:hypothetical protein
MEAGTDLITVPASLKRIIGPASLILAGCALDPILFGCCAGIARVTLPARVVRQDAGRKADDPGAHLSRVNGYMILPPVA